MKVFKTEVFQGNMNKKNYFEGWYFKHVSEDGKSILSFIPGISLDKNDRHAFIQIIDGMTGKTSYIKYSIEDFSYSKKNFYISIGNNEFTQDYISLDIDTNEIKAQAFLEYDKLSPYPQTLLSPNIMGVFSYIPFMECNHGVISSDHSIKGQAEINGVVHNFTNGHGYIEKDWGNSFPESWLWLQSNTFSKKKTSLFLSIAKIPWLKNYFLGFICFVFIDGKYYTFATYNRSKIINISFKNSCLEVELKNKHYSLIIKAIQGKSGELKAPDKGTMSRLIKESINSTVSFILKDSKGNIIREDSGTQAGLEIIEEIFSYF